MRNLFEGRIGLSWLGHVIDRIDIAFEALKTIAKETRKLVGAEAGLEWLKNYPTWCMEPQEIWDPIQIFLWLPYWRRTWIF